jgi:ribonuclease MRP protein subunit RMP1
MSNPSPIQPSLDLLSPALGILDLFAHRNKNQHRLSKWWAQFDMLRRGARKLLADMQACLESQAKLASSKKKKKSQQERDDALRRRMETRARYMEEHVLPRAYL